MKKKKNNANNYNTGIAAEYFVLSQLYRQNIEAYISQGNKKAIDIVIIKSDKNAISIDVKAVRGYSSLIVNNVKPKKDHYIVFVTYNNKFEKIDILPEIFVVPSLDIPKIEKIFKKERRIMKNNLKKYKNRWGSLS